MPAKKVSVFNSDGTNQRATVIVGLGFRGSDGELYVVDGDQTTGGININGTFTPAGTQDTNLTQVASAAVLTNYGLATTNAPRFVANISVAGAAVATSNPMHVAPGTGAVFVIQSNSIDNISNRADSINSKLGTQTDSDYGAPSIATQRVAAMLGVGSGAVTNANPVPVAQQGTTSTNIALINSGAVETSYGTPATSSVRVAAMLGVGTAANSAANPIFADQRFTGGIAAETGFGTPSTGGQRIAAMLGLGAVAASANAGATDAGTQRVVANIQRAGNELDYGQGAANTNTIRVSVANEQSPNMGATPTQITSASILPYIQDFASVNLTTTYTQLIASVGASTNSVEVFNGSGTPIYLSIGAAASEIVQYIVPPGGSAGFARLRISVGSRIAIRAHTGTITSGYFITNFFQTT